MAQNEKAKDEKVVAKLDELNEAYSVFKQAIDLIDKGIGSLQSTNLGLFQDFVYKAFDATAFHPLCKLIELALRYASEILPPEQEEIFKDLMASKRDLQAMIAGIYVHAYFEKVKNIIIDAQLAALAAAKVEVKIKKDQVSRATTKALKLHESLKEIFAAFSDSKDKKQMFPMICANFYFILQYVKNRREHYGSDGAWGEEMLDRQFIRYLKMLPEEEKANVPQSQAASNVVTPPSQT